MDWGNYFSQVVLSSFTQKLSRKYRKEEYFYPVVVTKSYFHETDSSHMYAYTKNNFLTSGMT